MTMKPGFTNKESEGYNLGWRFALVPCHFDSFFLLEKEMMETLHHNTDNSKERISGSSCFYCIQNYFV